jgi:Tol biopolymer transport system component
MRRRAGTVRSLSKAAIAGAISTAWLTTVVTPASATFPGQNGRIAYIDAGHVMTMTADGADMRQLTTGHGNDSPSFSANGKRIVYSHRLGKRYVIDVMNANGSRKRQLTGKHQDFDPTFAPSGGRIVFSRELPHGQHGGVDLFVMRSNGSHVEELKHASYALWQPSFSPNGKTIVFNGREGEDSFISAISASGTHARPLRDNVWEPTFAPSGQQILFDDWTGTAIGAIDTDGSDPHDITPVALGLQHYFSPSYSPNGSKIVFAGGSGRASDIYVMNADGSGIAKLTQDGGSGAPNWGPRPG